VLPFPTSSAGADLADRDAARLIKPYLSVFQLLRTVDDAVELGGVAP